MRTASNVMLKHFLFSFDMRLPYHLAETLVKGGGRYLNSSKKTERSSDRLLSLAS
jgi:hypothetical protein